MNPFRFLLLSATTPPRPCSDWLSFLCCTFDWDCIAHLLLPLSFSRRSFFAQAMTNISNYGPVRRLSSPVSADNRKPYSRAGLKGVLGTLDLNSGDAAVPTTLDSPYYPFHVETPQLEAPTQSPFTVPDGSRDIAGFPTYEQYHRIEEEYLSSLSDRKQPKALISQSLFDKIYAVLQNGSEDRASTAQFRFWVRKMFVLAYPQTSFNHNKNNTTSSSQSPNPVVLHDKRPVAIKERLYEVLCYCHAVARHGGRDKTCATLRLHYSWVPKELTAKFVKACPTCTLKRSGNPDLLSQFSYAAPPPSYLPSAPAPAPEPALLSSGGPNDSSSGLSFADNNAGSSSSTAASSNFAPSIFAATPDLSVYPSPTLSTGSGGGPMTPSPYLHGGLFGYPAVFDPGHHTTSTLSSVFSWDPSPSSPCVQGPVYNSGAAGSDGEQPGNADDSDEPARQALHLHLPAPRNVTRFAHSNSNNNSSYDNNNNNRRVVAFEQNQLSPPPPQAPPGIIDPSLFMEGFPTPPGSNTTRQQQQQQQQQWDATTTTSFGVPSLHLLLHLPSNASPQQQRTSQFRHQQHQSHGGGMVFAPVPVPVSVGRMRSVLCGMQEMEAEAEAEAEEQEQEQEQKVKMERECEWESPEAWLVPSDSVEELVLPTAT